MDAHVAPGIDGLLALVARRMAQAAEDPFGNPVLSIALAITRMQDDGALDAAAMAALVRDLRDQAFAARARRLAAYVGGADEAANQAALEAVARTVLRPDPADSPVRWAEFRASIERARYAAVFTAHPTFSLAPEAAQALAALASGAPGSNDGLPALETHRPPPITLESEFGQSIAAIQNGRDALDRLNDALLKIAAKVWPDRWTTLLPRPVILSTWVGYDTDGRTDIGWPETLGLRLRVKMLQLDRLAAQIEHLPHTGALMARLDQARDAVHHQIKAAAAATPNPPPPSPASSPAPATTPSPPPPPCSTCSPPPSRPPPQTTSAPSASPAPASPPTASPSPTPTSASTPPSSTTSSASASASATPPTTRPTAAPSSSASARRSTASNPSRSISAASSPSRPPPPA